MPNWCSNRVEVFDTEENIKKFREYVSDGNLLFSFNKIKPMPEELKDIDDIFVPSSFPSTKILEQDNNTPERD